MEPNSVGRSNWAINHRAEALVSKHMAEMAQRRLAVPEEDINPLPGDLRRSAEDIPGRAEVNFSADSQSYNPAGVAEKLMHEDASSSSGTVDSENDHFTSLFLNRYGTLSCQNVSCIETKGFLYASYTEYTNAFKPQLYSKYFFL